jgi:hypothetical protein
MHAQPTQIVHDARRSERSRRLRSFLRDARLRRGSDGSHASDGASGGGSLGRPAATASTARGPETGVALGAVQADRPPFTVLLAPPLDSQIESAEHRRVSLHPSIDLSNCSQVSTNIIRGARMFTSAKYR